MKKYYNILLLLYGYYYKDIFIVLYLLKKDSIIGYNIKFIKFKNV